MKCSSLISIIIPVYNVKDFLDKCVESVCSQTYANLEIILVDDGSTDGSGELCDKWAAFDDRIIVIHKENGGVSDARNAGLDIAKGEYIGFVDSDDFIEPGMYEHLFKTLNHAGNDLVMCAYRTVDENGEPCRQIYDDIADCVISTSEYITMINQNPRYHSSLMVVSNKLYRRHLLQDKRFRVGIVHEDAFFLNEIFPDVRQIEILNKQYYNYRQRTGSVMHVQFSEKRMVCFYAVKERLNFCKNSGFDFACIRAVARECINTGVRFWMLAITQKIADDEKCKQFYRDVLEVKREYSQYGSWKQKIFWNVFEYTPWLLKGVYGIYRAVKRR